MKERVVGRKGESVGWIGSITLIWYVTRLVFQLEACFIYADLR